MTDVSKAIAPKSDQLNADDLMTGPRTIRITAVHVRDSPEQPISVSYDGDQGKPWKPCKSMTRVMAYFWGADSSAWVGRSATLFREPSVKWAGVAIGGIRISHMSDIDQDVTIALTETKGKRTPTTIRRLETTVAPTKERGNIEHALSTIEKWGGDKAPLIAATEKQLDEKAWSKVERAQIKAALEGKV